MFTLHSSETEYYDYGITRTNIANGTITVIRTEGNVIPDAVNTWASLLVLTMQEWDSDRPIAVIHDLTHPNQGVTPYVRQRTIDVMKQIPENMIVYNALILPDTFIRRIIDMFTRTPIFQRENVHIRIFGCQRTAQQWLEKQLAKV
ncbi:MAG: hypothetical protein AAFV93_07035 [Chloroflexota bacterium]